MAKNKLELRDYSEKIWSVVNSQYETAKAEYEKVWKPKRITLIVLTCFAIIPGILYWYFSYNTNQNKHRRQKAADELVFSALKNLPKVNSDIEEIITESTLNREIEQIDLPIGAIRSFEKIFSTRSQWDSFWIDKFKRNSSIELGSVLKSYNILPEFTGRRRGALNVLGAFMPPNTYKRLAELHTTTRAAVRLKSGGMIEFYNLRVDIKFFYYVYVKDKSGNRTRIDKTKVSTLWSGLIATTSYSAHYPSAFKVKSKKFTTKRDNLFQKTFKKLEFELESIDFEENFDLKVQNEEPIEIRKQFSLNVLGLFLDLQEKTLPFMMSSVGSEGKVAFAFDNNTKGFSGAYDMPLHIEWPTKFFKNETFAKKELNKDFSTMLNVISAIDNLEKVKFFKEVKK
ncbi:MAG: hypothetical protein NC236_02940 [Mycoplasma sp.]|nr:hypothetical protein [Mycoplasma sp.]